MESLRPLQTLADLQDALSAARTDYNHSSAKVVTNKKNIRISKKMAFRSSFVTKSNHAGRSETADTKKQLEVDQAVAASNVRESEERHTQIFVSNTVKEILCLQLHPSTTISDLKELLQEKLNIQAKTQHLVTKRGIELCDTQSLMVLGIQQDTNLELCQVAGLMGGTRKRNSGKGKKSKTAKTQDEHETKHSSESKQEDLSESMGTSSAVAGIPGTSTRAVQPQRTSPGTEDVPKKSRETKERMKLQVQEEQAPQQSTSTEKQDPVVQPQRTFTGTGAIPKNPRGMQQQAKLQSQEKPKPHQSALVHLLEEPKPHQSASSAAGNINETTSNCAGEDIVPAFQKDLATRSQSSDVPTFYQHQSQAIVKDMSVGEGSAVFMAPTSGITINKNVIHVNVPGCTTTSGKTSHATSHATDRTTSRTRSHRTSHTKSRRKSRRVGTPDPNHQAQAVADEAKDALKKVYQDTGSFVQMLPWVGDDKIHIMDIYTKLVLVEHVDKVGKIVKEKKQMESYEDIFQSKTREDNPIKRIVFSGSAGLGKTTLIDKIAYDWATGMSEILKRFELVFVLKMHALKQTSDLIDAIFEQLLYQNSVNKSNLKEFIDKNQDKVLILLDGFDEFQTTTLNKSSFGSILEVLNRRQGKECWVVIASRPPLDKLVSSSLVEKPFTHVEIEGFSDTDIAKYINKFFPEDHDKVRKLIEKIESSEVLSDLAKSPMLLLLMCLLWRESGKLPDTMTRLYTEALKYIFRRKAKDLSQNAVSQILISIGKVALHGLISANQSLSFKEEDFEQKAFDAAISAGVLTTERVFKKLDIHNNVCFIHKTFLEFCAAMYLQSLMETEEFGEILDQVCSAKETYRYPSPYEYLLKFCCGDNDKCTNQVLQKLQKNLDPRLGLICYFESQSKSLPSEDFINVVVRTKIRIVEWNRDCMNSFFYLLKNIADQTEIQDNGYLSKVNVLSFEGCDLWRFGCDFAHCLNKMTNICILDLNSSPSFPIHMRTRFKALGGCVSMLVHALKRLKHLKRLSLKYCNLTGGNMGPIAESLSDIPTLVDLDLSNNETLGGCASLWVSSLKRMKHLKKLGFYFCNITWEDIGPIAESLSDMPTLVDLDLSGNETLAGFASLWAPSLKRMKHLKKLGFYFCKLTWEDIGPIAESLSDMPTLVDLDLSWNHRFLGGYASLWAPSLKRMKHLKKLGFTSCFIKGKDIGPIAETLSDMPTLIELDLSENEALASFASLWASSLKRMKHLKKLKFKSCNITREDIGPIAESLSDMPTLVDLDLSYNKTLGGCASLWAFSLKRMKHLKKLGFTSCNITGEDIGPIAETLSDMPTLIELDLSINEALGGCASLWAFSLKRMKHLKKLGLTLCNLTGGDLRLVDVARMDNITLDVQIE